MEQTTAQIKNQQAPMAVAPELKYCLYARKSTEAEDKQALSIESQVKEMTALAERDNLRIVDIKRESHSSKEVGQRPVFNQMIAEVRWQIQLHPHLGTGQIKSECWRPGIGG